MDKRFKTKDEIYRLLEQYGLEWMSRDYKTANSRLLCIDSFGYLYEARIAGMTSGHSPERFGKSNKYTLYNIENFLNINNKNFKLIDGQSYLGSTTAKLKFLCSCGSEFEMKANNVISQNQGCPYCCRNSVKINNTNSIRAVANWMLEYLYNKNDSDLYAPNSMIKLKMKCPDCGFIKHMKPNDLNYYGFSCNCCSDGFSIPEKFMFNILKESQLEFTSQYCPSWTNNKRYDFYVPEYNTIIEVHGSQHYNQATGTFGRLEDIFGNDILKKNMAIDNGKLYIEINATKTDFDFLKNNIIDELGSFIDFTDFDFDKCWSTSLSSIIIKVKDMIKSGFSKKQILFETKISEGTFYKYKKRIKNFKE